MAVYITIYRVALSFVATFGGGAVSFWCFCWCAFATSTTANTSYPTSTATTTTTIDSTHRDDGVAVASMVGAICPWLASVLGHITRVERSLCGRVACRSLCHDSGRCVLALCL